MIGNSIEPKIVVAGWHDDSNKGDAAILLALLKLLDELAPNAKFYIQMSVHHSSPLYSTMLRHTQSLFHKPIIPLTSFFRRSSNKKLLRMFELLLFLIRSLLLLLFPKMASKVLLDPEEKRALTIYLDCKCVVGKGGHYFYGGKRPTDLVRAYIQAFPFLLARRLGIPYVLVGISVGPYSSWFERIIPRLVFTGAAAVSAREKVSFEEICRIVGVRERVFRTTDTAIWLETNCCQGQNTQTTDGLNESYVIFCPRVVFPKDKHRVKYKRYLTISKWLLYELVNTYHRKVVVLLNAVRSIKESGHKTTEDDSQFVIDIQRNEPGLKDVVFITKDLNPIDILKIYKDAEFVIGTRLHSIIFALLCCKPFIAISYYGPKMTVAADYDMDQFVVNIKQLDHNRLEELIKYIITNKNELIQRIQSQKVIVKNIIHNDGALRVLHDLITKGGCKSD